METPDYLFDLSPYSRTTRRVLPLRPPRRSVMPPEVWAALLRVKRALDETSRTPEKRWRR
jgi:hypothetical protein